MHVPCVCHACAMRVPCVCHACALCMPHVCPVRARYAEAELGFRRALEIKAEILPPHDPQLAVVLNNLASTMEKLGSPREAQALYRGAIAICHASLPPGHPRLKHIQAKLTELELQLFSFPGMEPPPMPMPGAALGAGGARVGGGAPER